VGKVAVFEEKENWGALTDREGETIVGEQMTACPSNSNWRIKCRCKGRVFQHLKGQRKKAEKNVEH